MNTLLQIRFVWKPIVFLTCLLPFVLIVGDAFEITGNLGANPVEAILDRFGNWTLRFIMIRLLHGWRGWLRVRKSVRVGSVRRAGSADPGLRFEVPCPRELAPVSMGPSC